jgi:hypothetical protein
MFKGPICKFTHRVEATQKSRFQEYVQIYLSTSSRSMNHPHVSTCTFTFWNVVHVQYLLLH